MKVSNYKSVIALVHFDDNSLYLTHYGRKGMKWGENKFEEDDVIDFKNKTSMRDMSDQEKTKFINEYQRAAKDGVTTAKNAFEYFDEIKKKEDAEIAKSTPTKEAVKDSIQEKIDKAVKKGEKIKGRKEAIRKAVVDPVVNTVNTMKTGAKTIKKTITESTPVTKTKEVLETMNTGRKTIANVFKRIGETKVELQKVPSKAKANIAVFAQSFKDRFKRYRSQKKALKNITKRIAKS